MPGLTEKISEYFFILTLIASLEKINFVLNSN